MGVWMRMVEDAANRGDRNQVAVYGDGVVEHVRKKRTRQVSALEGSEGRPRSHVDARWVGGIHRPWSRAAQQNAQSRSVTFAWAVAMAAPGGSWATRRLTCDGFQSSER